MNDPRTRPSTSTATVDREPDRNREPDPDREPEPRPDLYPHGFGAPRDRRLRRLSPSCP